MMLSSPRSSHFLAVIDSVIREELGRIDMGEIEAESLFFADLGLASIDAIVLGEALQRRFRCILPFGELMAQLGSRTDRDLTIRELVQFLDEYVA